MYLEDLYITPNYRGKHIGSRLLKTIAKVNFLKYIKNYIIINYMSIYHIHIYIFAGSNRQ